ncbi:MAG: hypothetical protein AAGD96_21210, partial [Chloroflexota bacterium]
ERERERGREGERFISQSSYIYLRHPELSGRVLRNTLGLFGPDQITGFGDAFSPEDEDGNNPFRNEWGHNGIYTFRIEVPINYQGTVQEPSSGESINTHILRVELLDPDSINNPVPENATLSHTQKFAIELQNSGANPANLIRPVSQNDCSGNESNPCIIRTCEWALQAGRPGCNQNPYSSYYDANVNPYELDQINPFWFYRLDEMRRRAGTSQSGQTEYHTATLFTLYYFKQHPNGAIERVDLASYLGQSGHDETMIQNGGTPIRDYHAETDLNWVSPGAYNPIGSVPTRCEDQALPNNNGGFDVVDGAADLCEVSTMGEEDSLPIQFANLETMGRGFEINMLEDVEGILLDEGGLTQSIYLDVKTVAGASENGFEVWAGPPHTHYGLSSDVNLRNLQLADDGSIYSTGGVLVKSQGVLPQNSLTDNRVDFPLAYIPSGLAGELIEVALFDSDSGTSYPMCFYFENISSPACQSNFDDSGDGYLVYYDESNDGDRCFPSCNNQFVNPAFTVTVPDLTEDCDPSAPFEERMLNCNPFSGGRLMVSYNGGRHDTFQWIVKIPDQEHLIIQTSTPTGTPTQTPEPTLTHTPTPEPTMTPLITVTQTLVSPTITPGATPPPTATSIVVSTPLSTPASVESFIYLPAINSVDADLPAR